jgi:Ca-activated chloride channel homolog
MLTLAWPWMLVLTPLPWLYRWLKLPASTQSASLIVPAYRDIDFTGMSNTLPRGSWLILSLLTMAWLTAVLAASRPQWVGEPISLPASGRDLLLAVDISPSMEVADMRVSDRLVDRLLIVKNVVGEFVERRTGDRLGLILFGSNAYLQVPLTFDRKTLNTLLQEALIGFAGDGTAIGDAIGLAVKRLKNRPENARVVILLTDGANTAGEVEPLKAAELARAWGVKIYTIGIGADEIIRRSLFGTRRVNPSADLDEKTLTSIAIQTGGQYFRARSPEDLVNIYTVLDNLEPIVQDNETFRPTQALFHWPLALTLLTSALAGLLIQRGRANG